LRQRRRSSDWGKSWSLIADDGKIVGQGGAVSSFSPQSPRKRRRRTLLRNPPCPITVKRKTTKEKSPTQFSSKEDWQGPSIIDYDRLRQQGQSRSSSTSPYLPGCDKQGGEVLNPPFPDDVPSSIDATRRTVRRWQGWCRDQCSWCSA
jgi:hypothetical protein